MNMHKQKKKQSMSSGDNIDGEGRARTWFYALSFTDRQQETDEENKTKI